MATTSTAVIIGATLSGLSAGKLISDFVDNLIVIDSRPGYELSGKERSLAHSIMQNPGVSIQFSTVAQGYMINAKGAMKAVTVWTEDAGRTVLRADIVIDAGDSRAQTQRWLICTGYAPVMENEQAITLASPITCTVALRSYNYHTMQDLPEGLYIIGEALSNIAQLAGREEKLANVQAVILQQYLSRGKSNLKFQKNIANVLSIVTHEYIVMAQNQVQAEHLYETRRQVLMSSQV